MFFLCLLIFSTNKKYTYMFITNAKLVLSSILQETFD